MRKIESQMNAAIQANKNWKSGNTEVVTMDGVSFVYLHGNKIAMVDDTSLTIFDGGWQSNTTKSRLNALCAEFCIAGEGVFQSNFLWYVRRFVGAMNGKSVFKTEDFASGYVFAWLTMRLALVMLFVILGANLAVDLMDSNLVETIRERRETIQQSINKLN